jgi:polyhydroxyalkanoate synthesis regulator protein
MLAAVTAHNGPPMVAASDPVTIKLYANRRLYEPRSGSYVTFDDLDNLTRSGARIAVRDAGTGADITPFIFAASPTEQ